MDAEITFPCTDSQFSSRLLFFYSWSRKSEEEKISIRTERELKEAKEALEKSTTV